MKFLLIRFSSIGDIVLTTPVIRCIKKQFPQAEIHFFTKPAYHTILQSNPYLSKIILLEEWKTTVNKLRAENYDYIIDLHNNLRSLRLKISLFNVLSFSFNKLNFQKWLMTALKINVLPKKHIVDRYLETVKVFGIENDGEGLDYFIQKKDVVSYDDLPFTHLHGFVAIVIGAAHQTKKLPLHKLKQLCALIYQPIILLGGKEDAAAGNDIAETDTIKIYNACGKFTLNESADLLKKSMLVITHDTGMMHIAAALKKQVIAVWGNTVTQFGMVPYYGNFKIRQHNFEIEKLYCRPCSKIGYKKCPLKHFKCMNRQNVEKINETITSFLKYNKV